MFRLGLWLNMRYIAISMVSQDGIFITISVVSQGGVKRLVTL